MDMYRNSLSLFLKLHKSILPSVFLATTINVVDIKFLTTTATFVVTIVIWASLSYLVHVEILLPNEQGKTKHMKGFWLRAGALSLIVTLPMTVVMTLMMLNKPASISLEVAILASLPPGIITLLVTTLLVVPLVGTMLPAFVIQLNTGVLLAVRRGKRQYWRLVKLILIGPSVLYMISLALSVLGAIWFPTPMNSVNWSLNISALPYFLVSNIILALAVIMMSWVLCDAYLREENTH
ncbi:MAG: hypothetical protein GY761_09160 [Hyphomicrobiales bacterium]|nr:hypothetical protein [Hyphomicrobiales bacterium]